MALRDPTSILLLPGPWRWIAVLLNLAPIPGLGAVIAGIKNPHSGLLGRGIAQALLVIFGSYPLIVPGVIGFAWAAWTSYQMWQNAREGVPWGVPDETAS